MMVLKLLLGLAALGCVAISFSVLAFLIGFGAGDDVMRVAFFGAMMGIGLAGIVGLFFRGAWGAVLIVVQAAGLILFWLGPAERSSAPWFVPSVPLATALLGAAVLWLSRHRQGTSGRGDLRRGARIGQRGDRTGP